MGRSYGTARFAPPPAPRITRSLALLFPLPPPRAEVVDFGGEEEKREKRSAKRAALMKTTMTTGKAANIKGLSEVVYMKSKAGTGEVGKGTGKVGKSNAMIDEKRERRGRGRGCGGEMV